jgi:hypothetical protein
MDLLQYKTKKGMHYFILILSNDQVLKINEEPEDYNLVKHDFEAWGLKLLLLCADDIQSAILSMQILVVVFHCSFWYWSS